MTGSFWDESSARFHVLSNVVVVYIVGLVIEQAISQLITTPLDVIRNRLMTGTDVVNRNSDNSGGTEKLVSKSNYIQSLITLGREEGIPGLFAGATPRVAKAFLSGAIQFATYEETKQSIARMLQQ